MMLVELLTKKYPGMRFWLEQRITAIFMVLYLLTAIIYFVIEQPATYQGWVAFNAPWWWRIFSVLFFIGVCIHAWIGVRDVLRDYIFNPHLRRYLQIIVEVMLVAYLVWFGFILLRL